MDFNDDKSFDQDMSGSASSKETADCGPADAVPRGVAPTGAVLMGSVPMGGIPVMGSMGAFSQATACGARTCRSYDAPKVIESKNIVKFSTSFLSRDRMCPSLSGGYNFDIDRNEAGEFVLTAGGRYKGQSIVIGESVLRGLQEIIDREKLAEANGTVSYISSLSSDCQPVYLKAVYDSGEELYFYVNGHPDITWGAALRRYFAKVFNDAGISAGMPLPEETAVKRFSIEFNIDGTAWYYWKIDCGDKGMMLLKRSCDMIKQEPGTSYYRELCPELNQRIGTFAADNDLFNRGWGTDILSTSSSKDGFFRIYLEYESGVNLAAAGMNEGVPGEWYPIRDELKLLMDEYFPEDRLCPVCGKYIFRDKGAYEICPFCGWEDDPVQRREPDFPGGANPMSLDQARKAFEERNK